MAPLHAQQDSTPAPAVSETLTLERILELAEMKSEPVAIARAGWEERPSSAALMSSTVPESARTPIRG
jgi:hypothetical protein